jgi:hypothetical protein
MGATGRSDRTLTFEPQERIRRDQMASVVARLASGSDPTRPERAGFVDVTIRNVHRHAIGRAAFHGLIRGYDTRPATFRPDAHVSRGQAVDLMDRVWDYWAREGQE